MVDAVQPDILDIVPEHVAEPIRRPPWRERLATGGRDAALSILLNGLVVAGLVGAGFPLRSDRPPETISVELVPHMPGSEAERAADSGKGGDGAPSSAPKVADASPPPAPETPKQPRPQEPPSEPAPVPAVKPSAEQSATPEPAAAPQSPQSPAAPAEGQAPASQEAVPPPPEHPDADPTPRLVEAPSAPPADQPTPQPQPAAGAPDARPAAEAPSAAAPAAAPQPAPVEAASPAQRPVQSAAGADDTVATPSPPPETPKPLTPEERRQAANTATLAAMLPFGGGISGNPFTAQSPVAGQGSSTAYRGQVYANFNKGQDVIADAKARHLKGQAVVAFTLDDHGNLASLGIAVSSKNPEVDQAALELIRRAAPFPPPPPGAQRSFAPAIGLGLDD